MRRLVRLLGLFVVSACSVGTPLSGPLQPRVLPPDSANQLVTEAEAQVKAGAYPAALRIFQEVVRRFPTAPAHDRALYGLARALVLAENSGRDYRQAYVYFDRLLRDHPESAYAVDARAWRSLLAAYLARTQEIERLKQIDLEMERRAPQ